MADKIHEHNSNKIIEKYIKLVEDLKGVDYDSFINICSYCHLPENSRRCFRCCKTWCEREYYCTRPVNDKGVFEYCCGSFICLACWDKCSFPDCDVKACNDYNKCKKLKACSNCKEFFCLKHLIKNEICFSCLENDLEK